MPGEPVSHISQAHPDRVEVRGRDLTGDLMGRLTFTESFTNEVLLLFTRAFLSGTRLRARKQPCDLC